MSKNTINITLQEFDFLRAYIDIASPTFGNAFKSALKAGYTRYYARVIRRHYQPSRIIWLKRALKDEKLIRIVDASRNIKDDGVNYISKKKLRKLQSKGALELIGMTPQELFRELDNLLDPI